MFKVLTSLMFIFASPFLNLGIAGEGHDNTAPVNEYAKETGNKRNK